jgi:hypothetical protein
MSLSNIPEKNIVITLNSGLKGHVFADLVLVSGNNSNYTLRNRNYNSRVACGICEMFFSCSNVSWLRGLSGFRTLHPGGTLSPANSAADGAPIFPSAFFTSGFGAPDSATALRQN